MSKDPDSVYKPGNFIVFVDCMRTEIYTSHLNSHLIPKIPTQIRQLGNPLLYERNPLGILPISVDWPTANTTRLRCLLKS